MPRGGIVDIAEIRNGVISPDLASLLDFLPTSWSKWISANPRISIVKDCPQEASVQIVRDWMGVEITTTYSLQAGQTILHVITQMSSSENAHHRILSGYALWPDGGYSPAFDLIEITSGDLAANTATITRTWKLWNQEQGTYLPALRLYLWSNSSSPLRQILGIGWSFVYTSAEIDLYLSHAQEFLNAIHL